MKKITITPRFSHLFFSLIFIFGLLAPALCCVLQISTKNRQYYPKPPMLNSKTLFEPGYYQAWAYLMDTYLATNHSLQKVKAWLDYHVFAMTDNDAVYVGRNGWLFSRPSISGFQKNDCHEQQRILQLARDIDAAARLAHFSGRRFVFTVIPSKATIYPEFVGAVPQSTECGHSAYDLLLASHKRHPINGFVRLDDHMRNAKNETRQLYEPGTAFWNSEGAAVAARILVENIFKDDINSVHMADDDLTNLILLQNTPLPSTGRISERSETDRQLSAAVVYGGPALRQLLPHIQPRFDRFDLISSTTLPSNNHLENLKAYEVIMVMAAESQLADLQIDMDRFCAGLTIEKEASEKQQISLASVDGEKGISLDYGERQTNIKSLGAETFFYLPELTGSDDQNLRVLKIKLKAPHSDTLTWGIQNTSEPGGTRYLRTGFDTVYLPLPRIPEAQVKVNIGRTPGIFELHALELLSFNDKSDMSPDVDLKPKSFKIVEPPPEKPSGKPERSVASASAASSTRGHIHPGIKLNEFERHQIFQRHGTSADITVSGSYQGAPTCIEAQVTDFVSNHVIVPWTVVDRSPANGIFLGVLPGVPQGGWYRVSVRFRNDPSVTAQGDASWAVGILVACIGQSNMKEWFMTGKEQIPHDLVSVHRNGQWEKTNHLGNGAAAFADRLITLLHIPLGLLDYAVSGAGLRREADWGTGYWADRTSESIYNRFINGVSAAGGAVEYVVWMQGEADAARGTITENQYRNTLHDFIVHQVRHDVINGSHLPNLPFLIVGMPKRPVGKDAPHQAVHNALNNITRELEDCYPAAVTLDLANLGRQHLSPEAYSQMGRRIAQTVLFLQGVSSYYRGPTAIRAQKVGENCIDVHIHHRGGTDIEPMTGMTGFKLLTQEGIAIVPAQVERHAATVIRIYLEHPLSGNLRVVYLHGAMPESSNAVHDNSPLKLPLEPFELSVE